MRRAGASTAVGAVLAAALSIAAGGCTSSATPTTSTTTTTLPPLPPLVFAYVTDVGAGGNLGAGHTVIPLDLTPGGGSAAPISVGTFPDAIAITPNGRRAYVANYSSDTVSVIDLATDKSISQIVLGPTAGPAGVAVTPNGATVYVTEAGAAGTLGNTIVPISVATDKVGRAITVGGGPQGIAITPDGTRAYVANAGAIVSGQTGAFGDTVTPVDLTTGRALAPITVGNAPTGVAVSPDGSTVLVTNLNSGSVSPISAARGTAGAPIGVKGGPIAVAFSPKSSTVAYVADTTSTATGNVTPIDLSSDTAGTPISVDKGPQAIAVTPDGSTAWVVCYDAGTVVPIDLSTQRAGAGIKVSGGPSAIAIATQPRAGFGSSAGGTSGATTTTKPPAG